jgi:hypothetical protein
MGGGGKLEMSATCRRHVGDKAKCRLFSSRQANFGDMVFDIDGPKTDDQKERTN